MSGAIPSPPSLYLHGVERNSFNLFTTFTYSLSDRDTDTMFAIKQSKMLLITCKSPNPHFVDVSDFVAKYSTGHRITLLVHTSARSFRDFQPRDAVLTTAHSLT